MKQHPLLSFFVLALGISWAVAFLLIASTRGWLGIHVPLALHYLTAYGPLLAAFIVARAERGPAGTQDLLRRMVAWRVGPRWWLVSAGSPLALFAAGAVVVRATDNPWPDLRVLGHVNFLPALGAGAWLLWVLTSGFGEETGWRGFALPRLQRGRTALSASLVLWIFWILWHLPAFFYLPTYRQLGLASLPGFALGVLAGAILFTWLYNSTQGSILMVALWHGGFNFVSAPPALPVALSVVMSVLIMVWAVLVALLAKPAALSTAGKQVA